MTSRFFAVFGWLAIFGFFSFVHVSAQKPDAPPASKSTETGRQAVVKLLEQKVSTKSVDDPTVTLGLMLKKLSSEHKVNFTINERAFSNEGVGDVRETAVLERPLPAMSNVPLASVIRRVLERIPVDSGSTFLIRRDGIEITTRAQQKAEIWGASHQGPFLPLVHLSVKDLPMADALPRLAAQADCNVIVDPRVKEQASTNVSVSFVDTPLDTVLLFLCNVTETDFVLRDNVAFVTSKENAAVLRGRFEKEQNSTANPDAPSAGPAGPRIGERGGPQGSPNGLGGGLLGRAPGGGTGPSAVLCGVGRFGNEPSSLRFPTSFVSYLEPTAAVKPKTQTGIEKFNAALDKKRDVEVPSKPLSQAVAALRAQTGIRIELDKHVTQIYSTNLFGFPVNNGLGQIQSYGPQLKVSCANVPLRKALADALQPQSLTFVVLQDRVLITTPSRARHFQLRQKVDLDLDKVAVKHALKNLSRQTGVKVVLDADASKKLDKPLTLKVKDVTVEAAIHLLAGSAGVDVVRLDDLFFVSSDDKTARMRTSAMGISSPEAPPYWMSNYPSNWGSLYGYPLNMPCLSGIGGFCGGLCGAVGFAGGGLAGIQGGGLGGGPNPGLTGAFGSLGLTGAFGSLGLTGAFGSLGNLGGQFGLGKSGGTGGGNKPQSRLSSPGGLGGASMLNRGLSMPTYFVSAPIKPSTDAKTETPAQKLKKELKAAVTLDIEERNLTKAIEQLRKETKVNVKADWGAVFFQVNNLLMGNVPSLKLKVKQMPLGKALKKMLQPYKLTYAIVDDTLLITTEQSAIYHQLKQDVSVSFKKTPFASAVKQLSEETAVATLVDPRAAKEAETPVSLALEDVSLETVLRLSAEMVNLKPVRIGKVIYFTTKERADALRKEQPLAPRPEGGGIIGEPGLGFPGGPGFPGLPGGGDFPMGGFPGGPPIDPMDRNRN